MDINIQNTATKIISFDVKLLFLYHALIAMTISLFIVITGTLSTSGAVPGVMINFINFRAQCSIAGLGHSGFILSE
jgi:hypothetical protein